MVSRTVGEEFLVGQIREPRSVYQQRTHALCVTLHLARV